MARYLQDHQSGRQIKTNSPLNHPAPPLSISNFLFYLSLDCWTCSNPPASRTCEDEQAAALPAGGELGLCLVSHTVFHLHSTSQQEHPGLQGRAAKQTSPPRGQELHARAQAVTGPARNRSLVNLSLLILRQFCRWKEDLSPQGSPSGTFHEH